MKNKLFLLTLVLFVAATGCKDDFLDTVPENTISNEQLAANPSALSAIISGVYANLRTFGVGGSTRHVDYGLRGAHAGQSLASANGSRKILPKHLLQFGLVIKGFKLRRSSALKEIDYSFGFGHVIGERP